MSTEKMVVGPYELREKLGSHRRHHVYHGVHEETGEHVAVKLINISSKIARPLALKKIQLETRILKRLNHQRLVKILDAGIADSKMYIVMELIRGEALSTLLTRRGKLAWDMAIDYARQIAEGLTYIHEEELVHLKLNPDKILIDQEGNVFIGDLRLNRARKRRWDEAKRRVLDIAAYMAPEQMTDEGGTFKSDLYALGVIMFEMITGRLPYEPETLPRLMKVKREQAAPRVTDYAVDCPVWVAQIVAQMLEADPAKRPHTSQAVVLSLREVERIQAKGVGVAEEMARGFNPLTVGQDKTEARRLLGREEKKKIVTNPLVTVPAIFVALVLATSVMAGMLWIAFRPPSEPKLYENVVAALARNDERGLIRARQNLEMMVEHYPDGEYIEEAKQILADVEQQLAERRMKRRYHFGRDPRTETENLCVQAWQVADMGDLGKALELYQQALAADEAADADPDDVALYRSLARSKIAQLEAEIDELQESSGTRRETIESQLERAEELERNGKPVESRRILTTIVESFGDDDDVRDLVDRARSSLSSLPPDDVISVDVYQDTDVQDDQ